MHSRRSTSEDWPEVPFSPGPGCRPINRYKGTLSLHCVRPNVKRVRGTRGALSKAAGAWRVGLNLSAASVRRTGATRERSLQRVIVVDRASAIITGGGVGERRVHYSAHNTKGDPDKEASKVHRHGAGASVGVAFPVGKQVRHTNRVGLLPPVIPHWKRW